jgi:acyl-CoA thioester hydrolase
MSNERLDAAISEIETARAVAYPWLCDPMGHLATQHYMKIFDDAVYHLLAQLGYVLRDANASRRGWADVSHQIEYRSEICAGEVLIATSAIESLGRTSIKYRTSIFRVGEREQVCALLKGVMVHFDLNERRSLELPSHIRAAGESLMHGSASQSAKRTADVLTSEGDRVV